MRIETVYLWPDRTDVSLTAYLTEPNPFFMPKTPPPALIVCPGGGYLGLSRDTEGDPVALRFSSDGYQAFVLEYTVAQNAGGRSTRFPAQLIDIGKAILTLRDRAAEWNLDPERIVVMGFSAGAHLCATLATKWHEPLLRETLGGESHLFRPAAAVLLYGLTDYVGQKQHQDNGGMLPIAPPGAPGTFEVAFGTNEPGREQLEAFSPCLHVSEHTPPCFFACATDDEMVPAFHSLRMANAMYEKGLAVELHLFEKGSHGFAMGQTLTARNRRDKDWRCSAWVTLAQSFLTAHLEPDAAEGDFWPPLPKE